MSVDLIKGQTFSWNLLLLCSRTKEHPLTKCLYSYQVEIHTQLTGITEQARDILIHIASLGNKSYQIRDTQYKEQKNQEDSQEEISFGEELNDILDSNLSEAGERLNAGENPCNIKESDVSTDVLSEEKEQKYKKMLQNVVKNVQSSLGTFTCYLVNTQLLYTQNLEYSKGCFPSSHTFYYIASYCRATYRKELSKDAGNASQLVMILGAKNSVTRSAKKVIVPASLS